MMANIHLALYTSEQASHMGMATVNMTPDLTE